MKTAAVLLVVAALLAGAAFVVTGATVAFEEESLALEPGEVRTLHPGTPIGVPFQRTLAWSVEPTWLGQMDESGGFHAGELSGSGTVTARLGPSSSAIPVTVSCPTTAEMQGIAFEVTCGPVADVYVEIGSPGGLARARDEVERESDRVSRDLQITSDRRFRVYYLGSTQTFGTAVSWLGRGFSSGVTVRESDAAYLDLEDIIAIDKSQASSTQTTQALRHELVHRYVRQLVGYRNVAKIPTWLNEGLAFLEETETGWRPAEARTVSASSAHLGRLPTLAALTSLDDWNERTGLDHLYQYYFAAQAAQLLIDDITRPGLLRVLEVVATGATFPKALAQAVPTFDYDAFARRFSDRVAALLPTYPGITSASGSPDGAGITVIAYGLTPGAAATVTTRGPLERVASGRVDPYGIYVKYLGTDWPTGVYRVILETEGRSFEVTATR